MSEIKYSVMHDMGDNYPKTIMVADDVISLTDEEIDEILPDNLKKTGTIIHNPSYSIIKNRDFDGSWVEVT